MTPGTFSGGTDAKVQDDHLEVSADGQGGWSWFKQALTHELTADDDGKYFRAYSLVTEGEMLASGASAAIGPVTTPTTIGNVSVTVNDIDYNIDAAPALTVLMNDPMPVVVTIDGDANATYKWEARNEYPLLVSEQAASVILTLPQDGSCSVTCTIRDPNATDGPTKSVIINFWVVDAKTWAELQAE